MATVVGKTSAAIDALVATLLQSASINGAGHLTVTTHDGTVTDLGPVITTLPSASEAAAGIIQIATTSQVNAGTDDSTAVSPSHLAAVTGPINTAIAGKQPSNSNLTTIAAIVPGVGDVMQYESGGWTHRTPAQLATDIIGAAPIVEGKYYSGSSWTNPTQPFIYVGTVDPSGSLTVPNGSVWFDTSGV
jgi:hypothetical protein